MSGDSYKKRILISHKGLRNSAMATCLVNNVIMPLDTGKVNKLTTSELNQYAGSAEYKVNDFLALVVYVDVCFV